MELNSSASSQSNSPESDPLVLHGLTWDSKKFKNWHEYISHLAAQKSKKISKQLRTRIDKVLANYRYIYDLPNPNNSKAA